MSETRDAFDVVREYITDTASAIDGEWGCCHEWEKMGPKCAGYDEAYEALIALGVIESMVAR